MLVIELLKYVQLILKFTSINGCQSPTYNLLWSLHQSTCVSKFYVTCKLFDHNSLGYIRVNNVIPLTKKKNTQSFLLCNKLGNLGVGWVQCRWLLIAFNVAYSVMNQRVFRISSSFKMWGIIFYAYFGKKKNKGWIFHSFACINHGSRAYHLTQSIMPCYCSIVSLLP